MAFWGLIGQPSSCSLAASSCRSSCRRSAWTRTSREAWRCAGVLAADPARQQGVQQAAERAADVADQLDLGPVRRVDLGRRRVDVDDPIGAARVPAPGRVLDRVVAHRDHQVGPVEPRQHVVARLQPDRHQRQVRPVVDRALAHERDGHRDVEPARELAQLRGRVPAEHAVARQHDRALGAGDQVGGALDRHVGRLGEGGGRQHQRAPARRRPRSRRCPRAARCGWGPASRAAPRGTPWRRSRGSRPAPRPATSTSSRARTSAGCRRTGATPCGPCRSRSGR